MTRADSINREIKRLEEQRRYYETQIAQITENLEDWKTLLLANAEKKLTG